MEPVMKYHLMDSMGNTTLVADPGAQLELFDDENRRPVAAHIWRRQADGFYVDPAWVAERLFAAEKFVGSVWDPGCGVGRVADAARRRGYKTYATDIVDRGYQHFDQTLNFLLCERPLGNNIITNPPFQICDQFLRHALKLDVNAVAMIWLARRLNAAHWLADTPLARVYLLTPRPSMPPGEMIARGEKPRGGKQDFVWLVFRRDHVGPPELRWLHRDRGDER
jgi:hypothetical protein